MTYVNSDFNIYKIKDQYSSLGHINLENNSAVICIHFQNQAVIDSK